VRENVHARNQIIKESTLDWKPLFDQMVMFGERLRPWVGDVSLFLAKLRAEDRSVMFEGAQATLLDIDHGTYPFVTSSNPVAGAACTGAGVGPKDIDEVWGVAKAYATRVGSGPFPTEIDEEIGDTLREAGGEYGTTTGRPRRVGWIDLVGLRYAARINGLDFLAITKLDVLTGLGALNVATRYRGPGEAIFDQYPYHQTVLHHATGEYEQLPGWDEDISEIRDEADLPQSVRDYLAFIAEFVGVPVGLVGVGPGREQVIWTAAGRESLAARAATVA